jgi:hypothetical protein
MTVTGVDPLDAEWDEWVERVRLTYQAVEYTCAHRLADSRLAGPVAVQVAAGLVARPAVFRYWGLPYSGRIARLAEARIAEADAGTLASVCDWAALRERIEGLSPVHRRALVVTCVRGEGDPDLAAALGCDEAGAAAVRAEMLAAVAEAARPGLAAADPDGTS